MWKDINIDEYNIELSVSANGDSEASSDIIGALMEYEEVLIESIDSTLTEKSIMIHLELAIKPTVDFGEVMQAIRNLNNVLSVEREISDQIH